MSKQRKLPPKQEPAPSSLARLAKSPKPEAAKLLHGNVLPGAIYSLACRKRIADLLEGVDLEQSAIAYGHDLIERMAPRDPAEEMLVVQMLMAHSRVMRLTVIANEQEQLDALRIANEYADRASNTFRRLMLALDEYRKPPRGADSFTAIQNANIAGQQVVMNGEYSAGRNTTNEQGMPTRAEPSTTPAALPTEPRGAGIAPPIGTAREAVGEIHGATDT